MLRLFHLYAVNDKFYHTSFSFVSVTLTGRLISCCSSSAKTNQTSCHCICAMFLYLICALSVAFASAAHRHTYYLPGVAPSTYNKADPVSSKRMELSIVTASFLTRNLPFNRPSCLSTSLHQQKLKSRTTITRCRTADPKSLACSLKILAKFSVATALRTLCTR